MTTRKLLKRLSSKRQARLRASRCEYMKRMHRLEQDLTALLTVEAKTKA